MVRDGRSGAGNFWGRTPIVTDGTDVSGAVVTMRPMASMSGRTIIDPGARPTPAAPTFISVFLDPADGSPQRGRPRNSAPPNNDGREFLIADILPGSFLLRAQSSAGWLVKSIVWNNRDYTDGPFDMASHREVSDVTVTLTNAVPTLTGSVRDDQGGAAEGAVVMAFPAEPEQWMGYGPSPRRFKTTQSSTTGAFELKTLPAGEYYVVAVPASQRSAWLDPAFLRQVAPIATRVRLAWGETSTQTLPQVGGSR